MNKPEDRPVPDRADDRYVVYRMDDRGNRFIVKSHLDRAEAERLVAEFEARGHKQTYWAEREQA